MASIAGKMQEVNPGGAFGDGKRQWDGLEASQKITGRFSLSRVSAEFKPGDHGICEFFTWVGRLDNLHSFLAGQGLLQDIDKDIGIDQDHQRDRSRRRVFFPALPFQAPNAFLAAIAATRGAPGLSLSSRMPRMISDLVRSSNRESKLRILLS